MDFFKSVFSEPTPSPSPPSSPNSRNRQEDESVPQSSWQLGSSIFRTIASKSESLIDNYYKDIQEFSTEFKKETSVIRQAANRVVQDLPGRLESGAAIAQESLEAVGQAIDNVGFTVSEIISKDLSEFDILHLNENDDNAESSDRCRGKDLLYVDGNVKPYSRLEATIRGLQCNIRTYCDEVEESDYNEWKLGFRVEDKREEIEKLMEENTAVKEISDEVIPEKVDEETFWCRYFYRVDKEVKAEESRARIMKRAIVGEEEDDLSWDVDDNDDEETGEDTVRVMGLTIGNQEVKEREDDGVSKLKSEAMLDVKEGSDGKIVRDEEDDLSWDVDDTDDKGNGVEELTIGNEKVKERDDDGVSKSKSEALLDEKEGSDGKIGSDISIISSQRTSHSEDDIGWDRVEDVGKDGGDSAVDLRKRLSAMEDDQMPSWDIEDES